MSAVPLYEVYSLQKHSCRVQRKVLSLSELYVVNQCFVLSEVFICSYYLRYLSVVDGFFRLSVFFNVETIVYNV